jgi:cytochrome P450
LARTRADEPIFYSRDLDYWVITRYEDIKDIFKTPEIFSAEIALSPLKPFSAEVLKYLREGGFTPESVMSNCDPPKHTRIRQFTSRAFTPRRMAVLEPDIRRLANRYIDSFEQEGRADLVQQMLYDLPALVIFILLGIPDKDVPLVKSWSKNRLMLTWGHLSEEQQQEEIRGLVEYWKYSEKSIQQKLKNPGDDFPSDLLAIRAGDDTLLTINEITSIVYGLLIAGHETTTNASANGVYSLLTHRHIWQELCQTPSLIPQAVEEILRFNTSVIAWRRKTKQAVEIDGVHLPAGANLLLMLGSANRDESHFTQAHLMDIQRENAKEHLSFGFGIHYCFGAPLARLEMKIILEELTRRLPTLRLVENQTFQYLPNTSFRGPQNLWVEWDGSA